MHGWFDVTVVSTGYRVAYSCADPEGGETRGPDPPPPPGKSQAAIGFLRLLLVWIPFQKQKATPPCADPGIFTRGGGGGGSRSI